MLVPTGSVVGAGYRITRSHEVRPNAYRRLVATLRHRPTHWVVIDELEAVDELTP